MFGLAARTPWVRIESRARNAMAATIPDAEGSQPRGACIAPGEPAFLAFPAAVRHLLRGHMRAGATVRLSRDAGRYLCNYLCWKAVEATRRPGGPAFAAFIHIPKIAATGIHVPKRPRHGRPQRNPPGGDVSAARLDRTAQVLLREAILIARQEKVRRCCIDGMTKP
jgi:pyroglutamyl-peptidase